MTDNPSRLAPVTPTSPPIGEEPRLDRPRPRVHPALDRLAAYGWRLLVLAAVIVGLRWLLGELWPLVLAVVVALFLSRALTAPNRWLRERGLPPALAALVTMAAFLGAVVLVGWLIVPGVRDEFGSLGPTITEALDGVERWVVENTPGVDQRDLDTYRTQAGDALVEALRSSSGSLVSGAVAAVEAVTGLILSLIATFFFLKDGPRFTRWFASRLPADRRELAGRMAARAWATLGGYLRGAAMLGALESTAIGITLLVVGAELVVAVVVLTFAAAFVPFVGAIVAGVLAVPVTAVAVNVAAEAGVGRARDDAPGEGAVG